LRKKRVSKIKGLAWVLLAVGCGVLFAVGLSPLAHLVPWSLESKLGTAVRLASPSKECRANAEVDKDLHRVVSRLYPIEPGDAAFPIEVTLMDNPVENAYAGLGGRISVNSGLVKKAGSPEELAGVLAHEIEHVRHRHIMERMLVNLFTAEGINLVLGGGSTPAKLSKFILNLDFTRSQEAQADSDGLRRLQTAHVDNQGFRRFFERMEKEGAGSAFLSDHPSNAERMEMVDRFKNVDPRPILTPEEWTTLQNGLCGK